MVVQVEVFFLWYALRVSIILADVVRIDVRFKMKWVSTSWRPGRQRQPTMPTPAASMRSIKPR